MSHFFFCIKECTNKQGSNGLSFLATFLSSFLATFLSSFLATFLSSFLATFLSSINVEFNDVSWRHLTASNTQFIIMAWQHWWSSVTHSFILIYSLSCSMRFVVCLRHVGRLYTYTINYFEARGPIATKMFDYSVL